MIEVVEILAMTWEDEGGSKVWLETKEAKEAGDQGRGKACLDQGDQGGRKPCLQHVHALLAALKSDIQNEGVKVARDVEGGGGGGGGVVRNEPTGMQSETRESLHAAAGMEYRTETGEEIVGKGRNSGNRSNRYSRSLDVGAQPAATQPKPEQLTGKVSKKAGGGAGEGSEKKLRDASEKEKSVRTETRVVKPPPLAIRKEVTVVAGVSEGVVATAVTPTAVTPTHMSSPQHTFACEYDCGFKGSFEQVSAHEPICRLNGASGKGVDIKF